MVAICIGVDQYDYRLQAPDNPFQPFSNLQCAVGDARRFASWAARRTTREPRIFVNREAVANPIQWHFVNELIPEFESAAQPAAAVTFVFAGHGELIASRRARSLAVDYDIGLHCHQTEGLGSDNDRLELSRVAAWLGDIPAQSYLIVVDACIESFDQGPHDPAVVGSVLEHKLAKAFPAGSNWAVLLACAPGKKTVEDVENNRGLLTGALLDEWTRDGSRIFWPERMARLRTAILRRWEEIRAREPDLYSSGYSPDPVLFAANLKPKE